MSIFRVRTECLSAVLGCVLIAPLTDLCAAAELAETAAVYTSATDGYHTYRIPSLIVTTKGTLLAFAEGRKAGGGDAGDIDLLLKRSTDGGRTFSAQQTVWDDAKNTCGNPCPVVDRTTGTVWLLLTHNLGTDREKEIVADESEGTRTVWVTQSTDDGLSWAEPVEITATTKKPGWTWYATGPGCGIQLVSGRLLIPCDYIARKGELWSSHLIYSDDHGAAWKLGGSAPPKTNECEVVELADGRLLLNMRNYNREHTCRAIATSSDLGETFSKVSYDETLVEPVCQASIRRYSLAADGGRNRILFSNPAQAKARKEMTVRLSYDECQSWPVSKVLHAGPAAYSCLAGLSDGTILCLYERGEKQPYETIALARFSLAWLTDGKDSP
jgi:sialidase-1